MRKINENTLVCIVKKEGRLAIEYIDFEKDPLDSHPEYQKLKNEYKTMPLENCQEEGVKLVNILMRQYPKYFHEEGVLLSPNDSYSEYRTIGLDTLVDKTESLDSHEKMFYIYEKDIEHIYGINSLLYKLELTFNNYLYKEARKKAESKNALAISHKIRGWNGTQFKIDQDFSFLIASNFGYGFSSYFYLLLKFKDIKILPYTSIIYYRYINASQIINFTEKYPSLHSSWEKSFNFIAKEINEFNKFGKNTFVYNHITKSLGEMVKMLSKILETNLFYFVDMQKLDSYLDLNNSSLVYDYEHYLNNVNKNIIDKEALSKLINHIKSANFIVNLKDKKFDDLTRLVCDYKGATKNHEEQQRFAYAIMMLLASNNDLAGITDEKFDNISRSIVQKILDVEKNFELLIYRKTGIDLMRFRNERVILALNLIDNISSLNEIIDTRNFINDIKNSARKLMKQNINFINELEPKILNAKQIFEKTLKDFEKAENKFKSTNEYKVIDYLDKIFKLFKGLSNSNFEITDKFEENFLLLKEHVNYKEDALVELKDNIFKISGHGSEYNNNNWSIYCLRDKYLKSNDENKNNHLKNLNLSLNLNKEWFNMFVLLNDIENKNFKEDLIKKLSEIKLLAKDLNEIINNNFQYESSFKNFHQSYLENNNYYSKIKANFDIIEVQFNKAYNIMRKSKKEYDDLELMKKEILNNNNKMEEILK